jgi:hypothetical protein
MGGTSNNNKNNKSSAGGKKKSSPSLGSRAGGGGGKGVASLVARGVMLFSRVAKGGVFHRQFVFRRLREGAGVARFLCCALLLSDFPPPMRRWTPARLLQEPKEVMVRAALTAPCSLVRDMRWPVASCRQTPPSVCCSSSWSVSAVERSASGADHRGARRRCSGVERGKPRLGAFRRPVTTGMRRARIETTSE